MSKQRSLKSEVVISGVGLHTGEKVTLTFHPAKANEGISFRRVDLDNQPIIPALANFVVRTDRGTTLAKGDAEVHTVEHVLAALTGLDVDNCLIDMDGPEMPILDGSSLPFIEEFEKIGTEKLGAEKNYFEIEEPTRFTSTDGESEILALPADKFEVTVMVDYETHVLGTQNAHLNDIADFKSEIASSRTFSFLHELELLLDHGLIKGGDLNNAIVYVDKEISEESMKKLRKAFKKNEVHVKSNGILDNLTLHHPNEAARHKLLDVVGDLTLIGRPIKGRIIATKPGHALNTGFAQTIATTIKKQESRPKPPKYDPDKEPVYTVEQIHKILPHRFPFALVDKVLEISETHVVGLKNVTFNEAHFPGHFPGSPVMPGVLQVEAMAQTGGILALNTVPDPENYLTFFMKMEEVKFKNKVVPGDTLIFELKLLQPIRRGIVLMFGRAWVGSKIATEATLMAQIAKVK
jgi:UDP-3-O-[3-hydroxymyristoyl] N-acetylglucosamine deacetylase / 3-hydroxyacyl-[acyl-carrier-protein] dehydratase